MARPSRSSTRTKVLAILAAGATAASGAALLGPSTSSASSHREAPYTLRDPLIDNTDTYAFVSPDDPNSVTFVASWLPFQEPAGGPNFYPWDTDAAYDINVDNDGDARPDIVYRWTFNDVDRRGTAERGEADGTFLYNDGPVTSLTDENLLFRQTYDLTVITPDAGTSTVVLNDAPVAPSNVGRASMPDYTALRREAVRTIPGSGTGRTAARSYVGQSDDAFFLDLRIFDLLYGGDLSEVGFDTLSGYNVNTIAYQAPKSAVTAGNNANANPVIGVWSTTSRRKNAVLKDNNEAPTTSVTRSTDQKTYSGDFVQVSRLGNPLVNEVVVPANLKDFFNRSTPDTDAKFLAKVTDPEVPVLIEQIYKIPNPNKVRGGDNRPDLVAVFLTGISKANFAGTTPGTGALTRGGGADADLNSLNLNAIKPSGGAAPAEYLRLNTAVPPTAKPNRLGVIAGDLAGYPNGRRLDDDVTDITLQVAEGLLLPGQDAATKRAVAGLGDGVSFNDRPTLSTFPYIADPHSGSDPRVGQTPVSFKQNFTSSGGRVTTSVTNISPAAPGGFVQLYRVNADGSSTGLGSMRLNAAGTASATKVFKVRPGTKLTLNYRVFPKRGSAAQFNRGVPTTFTVR